MIWGGGTTIYDKFHQQVIKSCRNNDTGHEFGFIDQSVWHLQPTLMITSNLFIGICTQPTWSPHSKSSTFINWFFICMSFTATEIYPQNLTFVQHDRIYHFDHNSHISLINFNTGHIIQQNTTGINLPTPLKQYVKGMITDLFCKVK